MVDSQMATMTFTGPSVQMILTVNNIKAELSYAYLHSIASRAGLSCEISNRHYDSAGVDAVLRARQRFRPDSIYTNFSVDVQLKATSQVLSCDERDRYSFALTIDHYNKLREVEVQSQRLLVVFILPEDDTQWIDHSEAGLTARRCAYWVSLWNAPESHNTGSQTIYLPRTNIFSPESLRTIMVRASLGEMIPYEL